MKTEDFEKVKELVSKMDEINVRRISAESIKNNMAAHKVQRDGSALITPIIGFLGNSLTIRNFDGALYLVELEIEGMNEQIDALKKEIDSI